MKKQLLIYALAATTVLHAQEPPSALSNDSSRTIQLTEVTLLTVPKTQQQQLLHFYRANGAATLEEIMSRLPELSLIRRGSYGMEPAIRSFNGGQINVMVDGMRIHGACTDKMDPATIYIEPLNLDQLQVQTAGNGFLNGSSIGGTVNMKMAEPDLAAQKKFTGLLSSGYQTAARSFYESIRLNYAQNKWGLLATATYRKNEDYRAGNGKRIPFSQLEKINYSLSALYRINARTLLKADLLFDDGWQIGYPALPMDVGYAGARIAAVTAQQENPGKLLYKWKAKLYANKIRHFMDDSRRSVAMHMDMPGWSETAGAFAEGELKLQRRQRLLLKADASQTFLKASMTMYQPGQIPMYMLTWPDNRRQQYGFSAAWLWQIDSLWKLQLNARTDYMISRLTSTEAKDQVSIFGYTTDDRHDLLKNASVQVIRKAGQRFKFNGNIAYTERMPTASEFYGFYLFNAGDGYDYTGNPLLKPEQSLQAELSVTYQWKRHRIQLTGFSSRVRNFITGIIDPSLSVMTIGANGVKSFVNIGKAKLTGLELSVVLKPAAALDFVSTLRYTHGSDDKNQALPQITPLKNMSSVRWQFRRFFIQPETEAAASQQRISMQAGEDPTPGYVLFHFRTGARLTLFNKPVDLQFGIENITDRYYHEHLDWGNIKRPGRNGYVQVKLGF